MTKNARGEGKPASELGAVLRQTRELVGTSLRKAAVGAQISPAYLSQLEAGYIRDPSPRVLYGLARVYANPDHTSPDELYTLLMKRAGYVVPGGDAMLLSYTSSPMELALKNAMPITPSEEKALTEYLAWFRSRNRRSAEGESGEDASA
jgi:transcriptional regulator with XRE-family HTH domain